MPGKDKKGKAASPAPKQPPKPAPKNPQTASLKLDEMPYLDYRMQAAKEVLQLDTLEDLDGLIEVQHVVKRCRDVYGSQPQDMMNTHIPWEKYGAKMNPKNRPSPFLFPAFEKQAMDMKKYMNSSSRARSSYGGQQSNVGGASSDYGGTSNVDNIGSDMKTDNIELPGSLRGNDSLKDPAQQAQKDSLLYGSQDG